MKKNSDIDLRSQGNTSSLSANKVEKKNSKKSDKKLNFKDEKS